MDMSCLLLKYVYWFLHPQRTSFLISNLSSLTEAARVVGTERLMRVHYFNHLEALLYTSLPAGLALIAASLATEGTGPLLLAGGAAGAKAALAPLAPALAYAALLSFAVNFTSYWAISSTGSLTFKVAGCLKNLAVIWYSVAVAAEVVSGGQVAGYLVSVAGFLLYTLAKARGSGAAATAGAKAKAA